MENQEEVLGRLDINYDVFNALNLYNEELGQSYLENGFNPLGQNFTLSEDYIADCLSNEKNAKEVDCPEFLNQSEKDIAKSFNLSLENISSLYEELSSKITDSFTPNQKKMLQKLLLSLQLYIELLKKYIAKLKKEKNKYQLFTNLLAINWALSQNLAESFTPDFNKESIITQINNTKETFAEKEESKALIEKAKEIIKNNLNNQQKTTYVQSNQKTSSQTSQTSNVKDDGLER